MMLHKSFQRALFKPVLRMMRSLTDGSFDYRKMRQSVARIDRMLGGRHAPDASTLVTLAQCSASWVDVAGSSPERVIFYIHGGGFVFETPALHGELLASLCRQTGSRGFMLHYRLAPEHPYPAATEDCLDAYRHLLDAGYLPENIIIAGDSAGGNLTLVSLLRIRDAGLPLPAGAIALSPLTDATGSSDSMQRNARHDPMFNAAAYNAIVPLYLPDPQQRGEAWASPLNGDLSGLPPVYLLVGSSELLLDDAVRYALKCPSATLEVWHDMPHVFPMFDFLPEASEAQRRIARRILDLYAEAPHRALTAVKDLQEIPASAPSARLAAVADRRAMPDSSMAVNFYLILSLLAVVGSVVSLSLSGWWFDAMFSHPGWAKGTELLALLALLGFLRREAPHLPLFSAWLCAGIAVAFGPACGLPCVLYLRQRFDGDGDVS